MSDKSDSDLKIFPFDSKNTLLKVLNGTDRSKGYLETRNNHIETWLLNKFNEYIERKKGKNVHVADITVKDFEGFLNSLSLSPELLKNYTSRLKHFQEYIGLSEVKVKKNPKLIDKSIELEKNLGRAEKERDEEREKASVRWQVIEEKDAEIKEKDAIIKGYTVEKEKECSQCPKVVDLKATFDKKIAKYDGLQYLLDSGEIEDLKQLLAQKTEIEEQITRGKNIMENQQLVKVLCPTKGFVVSFGNDCVHCSEFISCSKYDELTNPARA